MYAVTQNFKDDIYSSNLKISGRVTFDISPVEIDSDIPVVTSSSEYFVSKSTTQLNNNIRQSSLFLSSWETNRTLLNGNFTFPSDTSGNWGEVGWVSGAICDANKTFTTIVPGALPAMLLTTPFPQQLTLSYTTTHTSAGLTITFDPLFNEYATDFTINVFNASNGVIFNVDVTGNTDVQYQLITALTNFKKIQIIISKWSVAYRRARIAEVDAGVVIIYENDSLVRMNLSEELDPIGSTIVIPEFEFTINNINQEFDIMNPAGIYSSLQQRQRIQPEIGLVFADHTEWVPLGLFYLIEWRSDVGTLSATFRGRSKLDLLDLTYFEQTTPQSSYNLSMMAAAVLSAAGVSGYYIDPLLATISTTGLVSKTTCREVLQMIAIAGQATIRISRDDVLKIESTRGTTALDAVTFAQLHEEPRIDLGKQVQSVSVNYFTSLSGSAGASTVTDSSVSNGEVITLDSNTLINTSVQALAVATCIKNIRSERRMFRVNWIGNPALEIYDYITLQTRFVSSLGVRTTKNELHYEGFLSCYTEGRETT